MDDFNFTLVELTDVPTAQNRNRGVWKQRFDAIPTGKAAMIRYNNRQRAHQVAGAITGAAHYWKIHIKTRVIHAEPAIHGTDGWLLYFWKRQESGDKV